MSRPPRRLVLVDGHPLYREGLETLLTAVGGGLQVIASTSDAAMALGLVRRSRPDLAVVDVEMAPPGGLDAVRGLAAGPSGIRVLAISSRLDPTLGVAAVRAGAAGYLPKSVSTTELARLVRSAADGWTVLPREVSRRLVAAAGVERPRGLPELEPQELRLWRLLADGAPTVAIAGELLVSERTAKRLIAGLLRTLGVENRAQAAELAGRLRLADAVVHG